MRTSISFTFTMAFTCAVASTGCVDSAAPAAAAPTAAQFYTRLDEVLCRRVTACRPQEAALFCPLWSAFNKCYATAADKGLIEYHGEYAERCLADLAAKSCAELEGGALASSMGLESCARTTPQGADAGTLQCDELGGSFPFPGGRDAGQPAEPLPPGAACNLTDHASVEACAIDGCYACIAHDFQSPGVCVQRCTIAMQDCPLGKTCRAYEGFNHSTGGNRPNCGDGFCE